MPRGRFAPSPSGDLHLGGARTALVAWLAARRDGGSFVLRIEDVDRPRTVPGVEQRILEDLHWLGLDWDEPPVRQSDRLDRYEQALSKIEPHLYPCFCSRADVAQAASAPHGPALAYPGTCRNLTPEQVEERSRHKAPSLRFRAPDRELCFEDAVHGRVCARSDDFIVRRADGLFAYQLAVVVDDLDMGIEEVVRGDDLLDSTPRQLLLYEALGATPPHFAHVPLLLGPDGQRLAKRHGAIAVRAFREAGWTPQQLAGWLASTLNLCPPNTEVSPSQLVASFDPARIAAAKEGTLTLPSPAAAGAGWTI